MKIIYHPGTGTILDPSEAVLVDISQLPDNPDEWEDYLASNVVVTEPFDPQYAEPCEVCGVPAGVPCNPEEEVN